MVTKKAPPVKRKNAPRKVNTPFASLRLESIRFSEFVGDAKEWKLENTDFEQINLVVGKNAAGKSRLLNVIAGLAKLLSGEQPKVFLTGEYQVTLSSEKNVYTYELAFANHQVRKETLTRNGNKLLERGESGAGTIWAEQIKQKIRFETPPDQVAAKSRRDSIQHPFFEDLYQWAASVRHYQFGTSLGKEQLLTTLDLQTLVSKDSIEVKDANQITKLYIQGFSQFGNSFDRAILNDLKSLGYDCSDVGSEPIDQQLFPIAGPPLLWLFVQERDLATHTSQLNMSQGMFRALSLVIHLNYCIFRKTPRTMLIDDIGEGLDFSRAQSFISLLIERALANRIQLIMTTNDRFVMNGVPLKYWSVIRRTRSNVRLVNIRNSKKVFQEFEMLGLNNFDFFSTNFFEEETR